MRKFLQVLVVAVISCGWVAPLSAACGSLVGDAAFARAQSLDGRIMQQRGQVRAEYVDCLRAAEVSPTLGGFAVTLQSREYRLANRLGDALQALARYDATRDVPESRADLFRELLEVARGDSEAGRSERSCLAARVAFDVMGSSVVSYSEQIDPLFAACGVSRELPAWPGQGTRGPGLHEYLRSALASGQTSCGLLFIALRTAPGDAAIAGTDQRAAMRRCKFGGVLLGGASERDGVVKVDGKDWVASGGRVLGIQESERVSIQVPSSRGVAETRFYRVTGGAIEERAMESSVATTIRVQVPNRRSVSIWIDGRLAGTSGSEIEVSSPRLEVVAKLRGFFDQTAAVEVTVGQRNDITLAPMRYDLAAQCRDLSLATATQGRTVGEFGAESDRSPENRVAELYRLENRGGKVRVTMKSSDSVDPVLVLIDPRTCRTLQVDDDGGGGRAARLDVKPENAGPLLLMATATSGLASGRYEILMESAAADKVGGVSSAGGSQAQDNASKEDPTGTSDAGLAPGARVFWGLVAVASGFGAYDAFTRAYDQQTAYEAIERLPTDTNGVQRQDCDLLADSNARSLCATSQTNQVLGVVAVAVSGLSVVLALDGLKPPGAEGVNGMNRAESARKRQPSASTMSVSPIPFPNGVGVSVRF